MKIDPLTPLPRFLTLLLFTAFAMTTQTSQTKAAESKDCPALQTLAAIAFVETGGTLDPSLEGALGERGLYQFRMGTWFDYTDKSFDLAFDSDESTRIAALHYKWLAGQLEEYGRPVTSYWIAVTWNAGHTKARQGVHIPKTTQAYAERVARLVLDLQGK